MKHRELAMVVALLAAAGIAHAGVQVPAPAQKKAVQKEKKEASEQDEKGEKGEKGEKADAKDGDKKVSLKNLPAAVKATVEAESKGAKVKGISSEKAKGKTVYELETLVNGRIRDLMIDSAGKVYVVEEQIDADKVPAPVRQALEQKGKIVVIESVVEDGKTTYEGQVQPKTGKKITLELTADGTPVKK
jgi:uncharacterized membrane protein YkoI